MLGGVGRMCQQWPSLPDFAVFVVLKGAPGHVPSTSASQLERQGINSKPGKPAQSNACLKYENKVKLPCCPITTLSIAGWVQAMEIGPLPLTFALVTSSGHFY